MHAHSKWKSACWSAENIEVFLKFVDMKFMHTQRGRAKNLYNRHQSLLVYTPFVKIYPALHQNATVYKWHSKKFGETPDLYNLNLIRRVHCASCCIIPWGGIISILIQYYPSVCDIVLGNFEIM